MSQPDFRQRRAILLSGLAFTACAGRAFAVEAVDPPALEPLMFEVRRGGALLGHHSVSFTRQGGDLIADIQVDITAKLGPFAFFHYTQQAREQWVDGRFASLHSSSVTNGRKQSVTAIRAEGGVMVMPAEGAAYRADARTLPLTHWNRQAMSAPLFNPQNGKMMREHASAQGPDTVQLSDGRSVQADRYTLTGENHIDDWYDKQDMWTALSARVWDGSTVLYRRVAA